MLSLFRLSDTSVSDDLIVPDKLCGSYVVLVGLLMEAYLKINIITFPETLNSGFGRLAFSHSSIIRLMPRPQLSKTLRLYSTLAISGICGWDSCSVKNLFISHPFGNVPGFSISIRSS